MSVAVACKGEGVIARCQKSKDDDNLIESKEKKDSLPFVHKNEQKNGRRVPTGKSYSLFGRERKKEYVDNYSHT